MKKLCEYEVNNGHGVMLQLGDVTDVKELKSSFAHTVNCTCTQIKKYH